MTESKNPYQGLAENAYWRPAVASRSMFDIDGLWKPKQPVQVGDAVATYGSCFAQHIGRALRKRGYHWLLTEEAPQPCPESLAREYGYDVFSSRTGNIYTTSLLLQWVQWALEDRAVPGECWRLDERWVDPFRPAIEAGGFETQDEVTQSRQFTLEKFRQSITEADVLVFTLGLTESWFNRNAAYEYPMCPGTIAGTYDSSEHQFVNQGFQQVLEHLEQALLLIRSCNADMRVILTVSPVPLTATASGDHVLVATMRSKSILRAVASEMELRHTWIDYFPSYEIINSPAFGGIFFEPNKRSVNPAGVEFVMNQFFADADVVGKQVIRTNGSTEMEDPKDEACEEALLSAFAPDRS